MQTARGRLHLTIVASLLVTLIAYIMLSRWEGTIIRVISGLLLSWFMPGFALMILLYPNKTIISASTIVLSIVTTFVLDILVGALLDVLNLGLNESGFVIGLWLITVLLLVTNSFTYTFRTNSSSQVQLNGIHQSLFKWRLASYSKFVISNYVVILLLVSMLFITASWAFRVNLRAANSLEAKPFTALTIDPSGVDATHEFLKITIDNQERKSTVYHLEMRINSTLFMEWENIILDPDEQWAVEIPLSQLVGRGDLRLFREGENEPYRQLHLVVPYVAQQHKESSNPR